MKKIAAKTEVPDRVFEALERRASDAKLSMSELMAFILRDAAVCSSEFHLPNREFSKYSRKYQGVPGPA